jgi:peptide/nickel transport system substrate-binding protein
MGRRRLGVTLLVGFALALVVLGLASAGTPSPARYGGQLVVALTGGEPASIDPTLNVGTATEIYRAMCETLYIRGGLLERVPVLAAGQPVASPDRRTYTVQLRKGIEFNDDTPFNAQAVVTTVQRFETYPGSALVSDYNLVDSVTAPGPYTVVFHLKQRDATFLSGDGTTSSRRRRSRRKAPASPTTRSASGLSCSTTASSGTTSR